MTNNEIIFETVRASFTPAQLAELVAATYTAEQIAARRAGVKITVAEAATRPPTPCFMPCWPLTLSTLSRSGSAWGTA